MRKILLALSFVAAFASQAMADWTAKDATPSTITFKNASGACTSVVCVPQAAISDSTGVNIVGVLTAGGDATSNATVSLVNSAFGYFYNGTTWDRMRGDTTNGLWVNVKNSNANVNTTSDGVAAAATWGSPVVNENYIFNGTSFDRQRSGGVTGMAGVSLQASPSGGASTTSGVAANSNNTTNIKASAGTVYGIQTGNINGSTPYYLKLYDKATAPTCGTDTPKARYLIPPINSGNNGSFVVGKAFTTGIGYCIVAGIADNDNTSVPAATILFNIDWN